LGFNQAVRRRYGWQVNTKYLQVLYKRYVEYKSFEQIAVEMGYTYDYIRKIHIKALRNFEKGTQWHIDM